MNDVLARIHFDFSGVGSDCTGEDAKIVFAAKKPPFAINGGRFLSV